MLCCADLEDDMSSQDYQQRDASAAVDEDADEDESAESSSESGSEDGGEEDNLQQQQQQQRPLSSRVRVVQGRRLKPPLAPKQPPKETAAAAAPAKRSFLTLAVSARECCSGLQAADTLATLTPHAPVGLGGAQQARLSAANTPGVL